MKLSRLDVPPLTIAPVIVSAQIASTPKRIGRLERSAPASTNDQASEVRKKVTGMMALGMSRPRPGIPCVRAISGNHCRQRSPWRIATTTSSNSPKPSQTRARKIGRAHV